MYKDVRSVVAISLRSNTLSLNAQRRLAESSQQLGVSLTRLSSGLRINSARDDAAGLAVASALNSDSRIFNQALRNVNDGMSAINIAQGALSSLSTILIRQKELATQAANGSLSGRQRSSLDREANQLVDEYNRIVNSTQFNNLSLLDANFADMAIQLGRGSNATLSVAMGNQLERNIFDGSIESSQALTATGSTSSIKTVDVNRDGNIDIVAGDKSNSKINIFLGNGNGTFAAPTSIATTANHQWLDIGDFDNNGLIDIVTISSASGAVTVHLGTGTGTFSAGVSYATNHAEKQVVTTGDFDGDGNLDLVAGGRNLKSSGETADILYGQGNGTFLSARTFAGSDTWDFSTGDVNGDGITDLLRLQGSAAGSAEIYLGSRDRTLTRSYTSANSGISSIHLTDVNRDGAKDLVTTESFNRAVYLGNGNGSFQAAYTFPTSGGGLVGGSFGDVNSDGYDDLLSVDVGDDTLNYSLNRGDGTFEAERTMNTNFAYSSVVYGQSLADLNKDGVLDFVVSDSSVLGAEGIHAYTFGTDRSTTIAHVNLLTQNGARTALDSISAALDLVNSENGALGAAQSRMVYAMNVLQAARENYSAAYSRIVDADVASETANMIRNQIREQTSSRILAQANIQPQLALSLLKG